MSDIDEPIGIHMRIMPARLTIAIVMGLGVALFALGVLLLTIVA